MCSVAVLHGSRFRFLPQDVNIEKLQPELQKVFDSAQLAMQEEARQAAVAKAQYKAVVTRRKKFMAVSYDLNKIFFEVRQKRIPVV